MLIPKYNIFECPWVSWRTSDTVHSHISVASGGTKTVGAVTWSLLSMFREKTTMTTSAVTLLIFQNKLFHTTRSVETLQKLTERALRERTECVHSDSA